MNASRPAPRAALPFAMLLVMLVATALACGGPTFVFPGGALTGEVRPPPESWEFARDAGTIQLETRPDDPYSVNIVCVVVDDGLYISAGDNYSQWVENMEANPDVRVRIDGTIYELRAERLTDAAMLRKFADAWVEKVSFGRDPTELEVAYVFHLAAR